MSNRTAKLQLRVVPFPLPGGHVDSTRDAVLEVVARIGAVERSSITAYDKPMGSFIVSASVDCTCHASDALDAVIDACGESGWQREEDEREPYAIWTPAAGRSSPVAIDITWAHAEIIAARSR